MVNQQKVIEILRNIGETIEKEKLFLTELDNVIGDGDHGINLSRGFQEVEKKLDTLADKDIGTILKTVGMTLVSTVGGASGPLYGTAFMKAGQLMAGKDAVDINDFVEILRVSIEGIKMRGKSTTGEKTMLDAMEKDINGRFAGKKVHLEAAYTCSDEEALAWKSEIEKRFPGYEIQLDRLSLSVACHIGSGAMAVACSRVIE